MDKHTDDRNGEKKKCYFYKINSRIIIIRTHKCKYMWKASGAMATNQKRRKRKRERARMKKKCE